MPKHVPTFKHLISTSFSQRTDKSQRQEQRSVTEILADLRANSTPPSHSDIADQERLWTGETGAGLLDVERGVVHPAEVLRRSNVAQRLAGRSVAGPAPPRSWQSQTSSTTKSTQSVSFNQIPLRRRVTTADLHRATALFSHRPCTARPSIGTTRLVEHCLSAVLRYLNSQDLVDHPNENENQDDAAEWETTRSIGSVMRDQVGYLEGHLKGGLLELSSLLPEGDQNRLCDQSVKALLSHDWSTTFDETYNDKDSSSQSDISWDEIPTTSLHHLPLPLHPSPISILRLLPSFDALSLTSLNLAYSTVSDLERLTSTLPAGLRELSLCGVRIRNDQARLVDGEAWKRGLNALGRKLIVLVMLDLSEPPIPIAQHTLTALLHPPNTRLPSLRLLGLRGVTRPPSTIPSKLAEGGYHGEDKPDQAFESAADDAQSVETRKQLMEVVRGGGRQRWIEVVW